jgi:hypothetical protein
VVLLGLVLEFLFVFVWVDLDVSFKFKLFFYSTEFNSTVKSTFLEKALSVREGANELLEFFLLETEAIGWTID